MREWKGGLGATAGWNSGREQKYTRFSKELIRIENIMTMEESSHSNGIRRECVTERKNGEDKEYENGHHM